jgi:hypothetical protein
MAVRDIAILLGLEKTHDDAVETRAAQARARGVQWDDHLFE